MKNEKHVDLDGDKKAEERKKALEKETLKKIKEIKSAASGPEKAATKRHKAPVKGKKEVREQIETDVDKLYELIRDKGILKVKDASKFLGIENEQVEEWGRILEEHKLVRLRYPPIGEPVLILKRFTSDAEKIKKLKTGKKLKPKRRVFIINFIILIFFVAFLVFSFIKIPNIIPTVKITYNQAYLAVAIIIILGVVLIWKMRRGRRNAAKKEEKT